MITVGLLPCAIHLWFKKEIGEGERLRIGNTLFMRAVFTQINLVDLVVDYLRQVDCGGLTAIGALFRLCHTYGN